MFSISIRDCPFKSFPPLVKLFCFACVLGNYSLGIAAARGNTAVVEYLIQEININKSIRNNDGKTPLDIAQETDHQEVVR